MASHRVNSKVRVRRFILAPALIPALSLSILMAGCATIATLEPVEVVESTPPMNDEGARNIDFVAPLDQRNRNYYKQLESVIDNRFIATGPIRSITRKPSGISTLYIMVEKTRRFRNFHYYGDRVEGLRIRVESYFGIPSALTVGKQATLLLRIRGIDFSRYFTLEGVVVPQ